MTAEISRSGAVNLMGKSSRQSFLITVSGTESWLLYITFHSHNAQVSHDKFVQWGEISAVSKIIPQNHSRFFKIHGRYIGDEVSDLICILNINPLANLGNRENYSAYADFFSQIIVHFPNWSVVRWGGIVGVGSSDLYHIHQYSDLIFMHKGELWIFYHNFL